MAKMSEGKQVQEQDDTEVSRAPAKPGLLEAAILVASTSIAFVGNRSSPEAGYLDHSASPPAGTLSTIMSGLIDRTGHLRIETGSESHEIFSGAKSTVTKRSFDVIQSRYQSITPEFELEIGGLAAGQYRIQVERESAKADESGMKIPAITLLEKDFTIVDNSESKGIMLLSESNFNKVRISKLENGQSTESEVIFFSLNGN